MAYLLRSAGVALLCMPPHNRLARCQPEVRPSLVATIMELCLRTASFLEVLNIFSLGISILPISCCLFSRCYFYCCIFYFNTFVHISLLFQSLFFTDVNAMFYLLLYFIHCCFYSWYCSLILCSLHLILPAATNCYQIDLGA